MLHRFLVIPCSTYCSLNNVSNLLIECRNNHPNNTIPCIPPILRPKTEEEGYKIALNITNLQNYTVSGYKIGATNETAMAKYKIKEPFYGRIFDTDIKISEINTKIDSDKFYKPKVEAEIAFRIGKTIYPSNSIIKESDILKHIKSVIPSIEIVDSRFSGVVDVYSCIADNGNHGNLVISSNEKPLNSINFNDIKVKIMINNTIQGTGNPFNVLGHPFKSLYWLVNKLSRHNIPLHTDQIIATGSITGQAPIRKNDVIRAEFDHFGSVQFLFTSKNREW